MHYGWPGGEVEERIQRRRLKNSSVQSEVNMPHRNFMGGWLEKDTGWKLQPLSWVIVHYFLASNLEGKRSHELLLHFKTKTNTPTTFPCSKDYCEKAVIVCLVLCCELINGRFYHLGQMRASPKSVSDHEHSYSPVGSKDQLQQLSLNSPLSWAERDFHSSV